MINNYYMHIVGLALMSMTVVACHHPSVPDPKAPETVSSDAERKQACFSYGTSEKDHSDLVLCVRVVSDSASGTRTLEFVQK